MKTTSARGFCPQEKPGANPGYAPCRCIRVSAGFWRR